MATLRALDGPEPLERFVELTKMIRQLEQERDGLKDQIVEALQHEPPDGPSGEQYVDFAGLRLELCHRARWKYSGAVAELEEELRDLKLRERADGSAEMQGHTAYVKATVNRARSEEQARERKASAIARYVSRHVEFSLRNENLSWHHHMVEMPQAQRDAIAKRAGQRSPSEKTWLLVMSKLEMRRAA